MSNLEETKEFLNKYCLQKCNHNSNESCICKIAICFKEIEKVQELESENSALLEENNDLYTELLFAEKQYKELTECVKKQSKVLRVIKEKNVDIIYLKDSNNVEEYNSHFGCAVCKLTKEEFNTLKEYTNEITRVKD